LCLSVLVLGTAGVGWWFYEHLNGNINSVSLDGKGGEEKADAFGRTPINILVMGSDGRTSKTDCKLGGGCSKTGVQTGSNADVEMVVHISADRSNATVMSIPRDTMTHVPACKDSKSGQSTAGYYGQINSALQYGPACQVATVHQLTGIPIDHFVKLDFSGVVKMSDAVGGVSVCVSDDVYDTYSHLKLSKGTHTLKGVAALEFVRSRHGFGDGSDLGRTVSQHIFLSAMIRKFKSAGTLTDPAAVYDLADAATKALTVDDGLGTVKKLIGLADDVNKVPTKRMTFTTMQTGADASDSNRVVVRPGRARLRDRRDGRERHRHHRACLHRGHGPHGQGVQLRHDHGQRPQLRDHDHPDLRRRREGRGRHRGEGPGPAHLASEAGHRHGPHPGDRRRLAERLHVSGRRRVLVGAGRHEGRGLQRPCPDRRPGQDLRQGQPLQDGRAGRCAHDSLPGVRGGTRQAGLRCLRVGGGTLGCTVAQDSNQRR
jgi:LCP family protein required for cell wall assembly